VCLFVFMFNSKPLKMFYLTNNISSWIPKWVDDVLNFRLTAYLLIQVSQAVVNKITSARENPFYFQEE